MGFSRLQVQVDELITDSTGGEDTKVSEEQGDQARGRVVHPGGGHEVLLGCQDAGRIQILLWQVLLAKGIFPHKLEALSQHKCLLV